MSSKAELIKKLRERTSAGLLACQKALAESNDDLEMAVDKLRAQGIAKAGARTDRSTQEGLVGIYADSGFGVMIEINSETDFVARNDMFRDCVEQIVKIAFENKIKNLEDLHKHMFDKTLTIADKIANLSSSVGEKLVISKYQALAAECIGAYVHNKATTNAGGIGVLIAIKTTTINPDIQEMANNIAMQIAAMSPIAVDIKDIPLDVIERERNVCEEKFADQDKPVDIKQKMIDSSVDKWCKSVSLLNQDSIFNSKLRIRDVVAETANKSGSEITLLSFIRYQVGS